MDVNGARFALLLGRTDWAGCLFDDGGVETRVGDAWTAVASGHTSPVTVAWDDDRDDLTLRPTVRVFKSAPAERPVTPDDRRGAAIDRNANVYWVDAPRSGIAVLSSGSCRTSAFWPSTLTSAATLHGDFAPPAPASVPSTRFGGVAITEDDYLVVGRMAPAGLLAFDLIAGGPPTVLEWPADLPFAPFDLATRRGGGVWILDRDHRRCWQLDRRLTVLSCATAPAATAEAPLFAPAGSTADTVDASGNNAPISLVSALAVDAVDAVAIDVLPDDTVLVLDRTAARRSRVLAYRRGVRVDHDDPSLRFDFAAHDFVFVAAGTDAARPGRLLIADERGDQAYAFEVLQADDGLHLVADTELYPLRRFGGKALIGGPGQPRYDFGDGWVPLIEQRGASYETVADIVTPVFDSRTPQCQWHRLILDACIPPGTAVRVWSRSSETRPADATSLLAGDWDAEPAPYLRATGPEIAWSRPHDDVPVDRSAGEGTWETLFQHARGRYLQVRLVLEGNRRATPRLRALRAWFPRFSYPERFLPAVYREDPTSASFVERLLANFEGTLTEIEGRITGAQALFDLRSAPPDALDWLADWFAIALDPAWDERRRRLFLRHTSDFFRDRGTLRVVRMALHLAFDPQIDEQDLVASTYTDERFQDIRIVERYRLRRAPATTFGDAQDSEGLRIVAATGTWTPAEGNAGLVRRWVRAQDPDATPTALQETTPFPLTAPTEPTQAAAWTAFVTSALGFVPDTSQATRWQAFLQRRYLRVSALDGGHGGAFTAFADIPLPTALPPDGPAQVDWFDFQTKVLAILATAHRFRVLLPSPDINLGVAEAQRRKDLAIRIVELEKPAHTAFEVGFYWAMFRIDEARLGLDTLLDVGSRAPQLIPDAVLGRAYVGESFLGGTQRPPPSDRVLLAC